MGKPARKMSAGKYRRFSPQSRHWATIHESGNVWTGAGIFCWHPLQMTARGRIPDVGLWNMGTL